MPVGNYLGLNINIPASPYVEVHLLDPLIAGLDVEMAGGPGIPADLLGRDPETHEPAYFGKVIEPSSLVVKNDLPEDLKTAVQADLWIYLNKELIGQEWEPYYAQYGRHFITYADPASLRIYTRMGWVVLADVAEKYGITNGNAADGKFPKEPIEKDGVKWVPIYSNPTLLIQAEDAVIGGMAKSRVSPDAMFTGINSVLRGTLHKGYDTAAQPITSPAIKESLHINYPNAFNFVVHAITNQTANLGISKSEYWKYSKNQLYSIAIVKDSMRKIGENPERAKKDPEWARSLQVFRGQSQDLLSYYQQCAPQMKINLFKYLKELSTSARLEEKKEAADGLSTILVNERYVPGSVDLFEIFPKDEVASVLDRLAEGENDVGLLRIIEIARADNSRRK